MMVQKKSISQITGVRGIVAFLIAYVLHWALLYWAIPDFNNEVLEAAFGSSATVLLYSPNLFFLFSGYLIHQSSNVKIISGDMSFGDYILPKIKKLYPIVITTAIITWTLQNLGRLMWGYYPLHADGGEMRNSIISLLLSFLGIQSGVISDNDTLSVNGPAWFVSVLFICYALYYIITYFIKSKLGQNFVYLLISLLGVYVIVTSPNLPFLYMVNGRGYFNFFLGVLIKEYVDFVEKGIEPVWIKRGLKVFTYVIAAVAFLYSFERCCLHGNETEGMVFILTLMFWPSLVYLVIHGYIFKWIFSFPLFVWLGKVSMPIFLCNFPTDLLIRMCDIKFQWNLDYTNPWVWLIHIIVSLVIVVIFHLIFEVSWKKRE